MRKNIKEGMMNNIIQGKKYEWEYVIGLEVHAQVKSKHKLFSYASTEFDANPNTNVDLLDLAYPGTLPVLNQFCVKQAVKTGLALNADIQKRSIFDRKHYFYPDLPQGYQISQFYHPIVLNGYLHININNTEKKIDIERLHLEQDAGKSIHLGDKSLIDFNRCGIALMEIVTKPCMFHPEEAGEFLHVLRNTLRYIDTCDGDMEKGSLRCDANVSVRLRDSKELNTRCEIKNLNSIKFMMHAIIYEAKRQIDILEKGGKVIQETRLFNTDKGITIGMRSKEEAYDYRYFPDPDLLPIIITDESIQKIAQELPELPAQKLSRYLEKYKLKLTIAEPLVLKKELSEYFDNIIKLGADPIITGNLLTGQLLYLLKKDNLDFDPNRMIPEYIYQLVQLIQEGKLNNKHIKQVFEYMFNNKNKSPREIISILNISQISDQTELLNIITKIIKQHSEVVEEYKSGKIKVIGFLVGQVMKLTKGKANPGIVKKMLMELLK